MCSLSNVLRLRSVSTSTEWQARWPTTRMGCVWAWHSPGCKMSQSPSTPLSAAQHTEQVGLTLPMVLTITVDKYEFKLLQFCLYLFTVLINFLQLIINVNRFIFRNVSGSVEAWIPLAAGSVPGDHPRPPHPRGADWRVEATTTDQTFYPRGSE